MARNGKGKNRRGASGGRRGSLMQLRGGFKGMAHSAVGSSKSSSTFWNVLMYILLAGAIVLLITRYAC